MSWYENKKFLVFHPENSYTCKNSFDEGEGLGRLRPRPESEVVSNSLFTFLTLARNPRDSHFLCTPFIFRKQQSDEAHSGAVALRLEKRSGWVSFEVHNSCSEQKKSMEGKYCGGKIQLALILPCFPVSSSTAFVLVEASILNPSFDLCWLRSWAICFLFPFSAESRFPFLLRSLYRWDEASILNANIGCWHESLHLLREVGNFSFFKQANI